MLYLQYLLNPYLLPCMIFYASKQTQEVDVDTRHNLERTRSHVLDATVSGFVYDHLS